MRLPLRIIVEAQGAFEKLLAQGSVLSTGKDAGLHHALPVKTRLTLSKESRQFYDETKAFAKVQKELFKAYRDRVEADTLAKGEEFSDDTEIPQKLLDELQEEIDKILDDTQVNIDITPIKEDELLNEYCTLTSKDMMLLDWLIGDKPGRKRHKGKGDGEVVSAAE